MSTQLYEKLFLVNNIPKIEGILQVRDMIKGYAYIGEMYMARSKEHSEKFKYVHMAILQAYSRTNPMYYNNGDCIDCVKRFNFDIYKQSWSWGFDEYNHIDKYQHCRINHKNEEYIIEKTQMISGNCYLCGEYIPFYADCYDIPHCHCDHNDYMYIEDDDDDDIHDDIHDENTN